MSDLPVALEPVTVIGRGRLDHHHWGTYSADVVIGFPTTAQATHAREFLHGLTKGIQPFPLTGPSGERYAPAPVRWVQQAGLIACRLARPALQEVEAILEGLGADLDAIESIKHSIDHGDPWTVVIPCPDVATPSLFDLSGDDPSEGYCDGEVTEP